MVSGWAATAASGERINLGFVIPHSNSGRCASLGYVGELGGAGHLDVGLGLGRQQRASWQSRSHNIRCIVGALHLLSDAPKVVSITVVAGHRGPDVSPALLLKPSHPPAVLLHRFLPVRAFLYILPWPSNRAWRAPPLAMVAVVDASVVVIIACLPEFGPPALRWWPILHPQAYPRSFRSVNVVLDTNCPRCGCGVGSVGRNGDGGGIWGSGDTVGVSQLLLSMELSVSSIAWHYGWTCLVGGLTQGRWERNNHSPGLLGPPDAEKVPKTLVSIIKK